MQGAAGPQNSFIQSFTHSPKEDLLARLGGARTNDTTASGSPHRLAGAPPLSTEGPGEPLTWSWARLAPSILHADLGGPAPMAAPLTTTWMKPGCAPLPATHRAPVSQACVHPSLTHAAWGRSGSLLPGPLALWLVPVTWPPWRPSPAETRPAHPRSSPRDRADSCPPRHPARMFALCLGSDFTRP